MKWLKCFAKEKEEEKERKGIRVVSWEEIERSTEKMSEGRVIGSGGFSTVYGAGEMRAAVKIVYGRRVFESELETLQRVGDHENIVKLIGYARHPSDDQLGALVLGYVPNGTLEDNPSLIPWQKRVRIAYQVARALHHLHHHGVVHGDLKPANVLLDRGLNAFLCDFGSAKTGFSSSVVSSPRVLTASPGYADPHYLRTGLPSKKNDVYSFGVLLLHLLTGAPPFCPATGQLLPFPFPVDPRFDPLLRLASLCLSHPPALRPCASQILHALSSNSHSSSF